jgi:exosortase
VAGLQPGSWSCSRKTQSTKGIVNSQESNFARRSLLLLTWIAVAAILFWPTLASVWHLAMTDENYSHLPIIPLISVVLLFQERNKIRESLASDRLSGTIFCVAAAILWLIVRYASAGWDSADRLSVLTLAFFSLLVGGFAYFLGRRALLAAQFPLLFLLFAVPPPQFLLDRVISFLQHGTASLSGIFFELSGVPVLREGIVFHLTTVNIEVARECSGIRSSIALLILAVLAGHFVLGGVWRKLVFVLTGIAVMIVKNAIRIVTLTLLANYVEPGFLFGKLHREGGVVFFLIGLLLLWPVLWLLQRPSVKKEQIAGSASA